MYEASWMICVLIIYKGIGVIMLAVTKNYELLIKRINDGESDAFTELYEATKLKVFYTVQKSMRATAVEEVSDIVQEVYIVAYKNMSSLRDPSKAIAWLCAIAGNLCKQQLGRMYDDGKLLSLDDEELFIEPEADVEDTPDYVIDRKATNEIIQQIVDKLPAPQRLAVVMYYFDEMTISEIAVALNCPKNTVKSRLNYARKAIEVAVLSEERKGVKLYSVSSLAIALALKAQVEGLAIPSGIMGGISAGIGTTTAAAVSGTTGAVAAGGATAGITSTAAGATGTGVVTSIGIGAKITACITAVALLTGGVITDVAVENNNRQNNTLSQVSAYVEEIKGYSQERDFQLDALLAAGEGSSAFITGDGNLMCCGQINSKTVPTKVDDDVKAVSASEGCVMYIKADGSLWGFGSYLGNGFENGSNSPVKMMDDVKSVSCGAEHVMVIKNDGTLWGWGLFESTYEASFDNKYSLLGDGNINVSLTPVKIMDNVKVVSASSSHTMAIKDDNSLWGWGDSGLLGIGTNEPSLFPVKILDNVMEISVGSGFAVAIKTDGSLWGWGDNYYGELGNGRTEESYTDINGDGYVDVYERKPIKIMDNVKAVSAGMSAISIVKNDDTLWICGEVSFLNKGEVRMPVKLLDEVAEAALVRTKDRTDSSPTYATTSMLIIKKDCTVWGCGYNADGQVGNGKSYFDYPETSDYQVLPYEYDPVLIYDPDGQTAAEQKIANLDDGEYYFRFENQNVVKTEGGWNVLAGNLTYDTYSMEEVSSWKPGTVISFQGNDVVIESIETDMEWKDISYNGGSFIIVSCDGEWITDDDSGASLWYVNGYSQIFIHDDTVFVEWASATAVQVDSLDEIMNYYSYAYRNAAVTIEDGVVVQINTFYHP